MGGQMELKHDDAKKVAKNEQPNATKPRPFAAVLGMTAGIALLAAGPAKAQDCPANATKDSQVLILKASADGKQIAASVTVFDMGAGPDETDITVDSEILDSAHITFQYLKSTGNNQGQWMDVPGCSDVVTAQHPAHDDGIPYAICDLSAVANEDEVTFRAVFIPDDDKTCSSAIGYAYGSTSAVWRLFEQFGDELCEAVSVAGEFTQTVQQIQKTYKNLKCDAGINLICTADKTLVKAGDTVLSVEFLFEKAGFFNWNVTKVDAKGITVGSSEEFFMIEEGNIKSFKVNFGEPKEIQLSSTLVISVKAEKGPKPGTAIVTVGAPEGYTELKKTTKEKMKAEPRDVSVSTDVPRNSLEVRTDEAGYTEVKHTSKGKMKAAAKVVAADQARREKFLEGLEKRPELDSGIACVLGMPRVCFANKVVLEAGDTFLTVGMVMEKGYFAFNISKVDEKGIEVAGTRFSFGETKPLVGSAGSPTLTVEKGPKPGTAIVTVSFGSQGSQ
jgi:hypothetical protein